MAACVNIWAIGSTYKWNGQLVQGPEVAMLFKVTDDGYESLYEAVLEMHPYETPCIVRYAIAEGHRPFLDWIEECVRPEEGSGPLG